MNSAGVDRRLHGEPGGEVGHILATVADGERVGAGIQRDVGDGVGAVAVVLDVNLSLGAAVRDDLDGQVRWAGVGAVHDELSLLPDLGPLQTGTGAANLSSRTRTLLVGILDFRWFCVLLTRTFSLAECFSTTVL